MTRSDRTQWGHARRPGEKFWYVHRDIDSFIWCLLLLSELVWLQAKKRAERRDGDEVGRREREVKLDMN